MSEKERRHILVLVQDDEDAMATLFWNYYEETNDIGALMATLAMLPGPTFELITTAQEINPEFAEELIYRFLFEEEDD